MINAFLPSDFASEFELAQVGETEVHALQYGVEDVANHLLKQPFSVFLDKLSGDESVRKYIDTFLRFADRPMDRLAKIVYFEQEEAGAVSLFDENIAEHNSIETERRNARRTLLYSRVFNIFRRLVDKNEYASDPRFAKIHSNSGNKCKAYSDFLYNNWVVSAPQILDFISIYGYPGSTSAATSGGSKAVNEEAKFIVNQLLLIQPNYIKDLGETIESTAGPLLELIERISSRSSQSPEMVSNEKVADWTAYLMDILTTLWCFVSVCENGELLNCVTIHLLPYFDKIVRYTSQTLLDLGGDFESIVMIQSLCVSLGAEKPIPKSSSKSDLHPDEVVLLPKDIEEELAGMQKKPAAEVKEENDLQAVYASIIAQYDEYEEDDDEYISGAFSLERQSSADGPEIIEETTNNSVNVAIVRDMDGSKKEVLVPNRNKLVRAPRSTRRQTSRGRGGGRGRGRGGINTTGGTGRGGKHTQNKRGQRVYHPGARGGKKKTKSSSGGVRGKGSGRHSKKGGKKNFNNA